MTDVIGIIPARSGSKTVKDKNIKMLNGHPLIAYSIIAALVSEKIDRVIVTTNSTKYRDIALKYGAEVPFIRPDEFSLDISTDRDFLIHSMKWFEINEDKIPEYWVHLRPTTPLRLPENIDNAIDMILKFKNATSLRSVHKSPESPLKWFFKNGDFLEGIVSDEKYNLPKESFEDVFIPNGYVDILKASYMLNNEKIHGDQILCYETPYSVEVDSIEEFKYLEYICKNGDAFLLDEMNKAID